MSVKVGLKFIEKWQESMEDEILAYEKKPVEKGKIVFYGPSNFTRWSTRFGMIPLEEALKGNSGEKCCINRGFGSSCPEHQLYYYSRIIRPLEPKVLVYLPGMPNGNSFGYTPQENWFLAQRVIAYAKEDFPDLRLYLCGENLHHETRDSSKIFDGILREYAEKTPFCTFVDIANYKPIHREDIYVEDNVHFNQDGYDIYTALFKEALKDELERY